MVKRLPAMQETWVRFLGREDPLEKEMAIHFSTFAWKIPWMEEPDRLQSMGSQRVRHDWATSLLWNGMKTGLFQSCGHCWVFQICWHIECSTFTASSFRIWNNSTGIPSPPLALFIVMLSKADLTSHSSCLALGDWSHHHDYVGREDLFCIVLLCILAMVGMPFLKRLPSKLWEEGLSPSLSSLSK